MRNIRRDEPAIERPLGATEELFWRFDGLTPINFAITARITGPLTDEVLRGALDAVQARHPRLRVRVEDNGRRRPWFRSGAGPIPLRIVEERRRSVWEFVEDEVVGLLDTDRGPLMRCVCLRDDPNTHTLILVFQHSISDGKSGVFIVRDIVQAAAQIVKDGEAHLEPLPPRAYVQDYFPDDLDGMGHVKSAWQTTSALAGAALRYGMPFGLRPNSGLALQRLKVAVVPFELEPELTSLLAKRAREEGTTVHGALFAAFALATVEDSYRRRRGFPMVLASAVDLRRYLVPPIDEDCGYFVAGTASLHKVGDDTSFWMLAREIREALQGAIDANMHLLLMPEPHRLFAWAGRKVGRRLARPFARTISFVHPGSVLLSNLGRFTFDQQWGPFYIKSVGFAGNNAILANFNSTVATLGGRLVWCFIGSVPIVSRSRLERIGDGSFAKLCGALGVSVEDARAKMREAATVAPPKPQAAE
ncbi:MAG: hypothetical protein KC543_17275 [Myxococcales bacterium]|nr:hypothetical protein [Myxococcales bacterium]